MNAKELLKRVLFLYLFFLLSTVVYADDSQIKAFFESGVTFGFFGDEGLYCFPEYKEPRVEPREDFIRPIVYRMYDERNGKDIFDLPPGYIENHIKDRVGDTVMVIFAGNRVYGVIDTIVYYWPELEEGVVCVVRSLGAEIKCPSYPPNIMILRKEKFDTGIFIPFVEYHINDWSYFAQIDSLRLTMTESLLNSKNWKTKDENPFDGESIICYGVKSSAIPDTVFLSYTCFIKNRSSWRWTTLLKLHKVDNNWISYTIYEPHSGPYRYEFNCAFDIDNDGVLEYYINNSIYQFKNGELRLIYGGPFIGDI